MSSSKRAVGIAVLLLFLGSACQSSDNVVQLTIFHTNDIHSHLKAPKTAPFALGGLAKLSTLLQQERTQYPNSITLDAGDWSEGTWYYSVDEGANMLRLLNAMKYDAVCLGNHDFLQGPDQLLKTIPAAATSFPVLAANLDASAYPSGAQLLNLLPPTLIKTVDGVRIGIIGLTTFQLLYGSYIDPVVITDPTTVATALANELRPKVDVLLLLSHNDITLNEQLAQNVPGVDAVISGHSHVKTPQAILVQNDGRQVPVVETGAWGEFLGDLKLNVDLTNHSVSFVSETLHPVTPNLAADPAVANLVAQDDQALGSKFGVDLDEVVAQSDVPLLQQDTSESLLGNLAVQSYRYQTGADMALEEISLTGVSVPKGNVSLQDLHDVVPHIYNPATGNEWMLNVWNALGADISLITSVFYTTSGLMPLSSPLGWLSTDNAVVTWNDQNKVPSVSSITIGGRPLNPTSRYTVALSDGLLQAIKTADSSLHLGIDLSQVTPVPVQAWQSVVNYAKSLQHLTVAQLGVGKSAHTTTPDLAIFYYDVAWDGTKLSLVVHNNGLAASQSATLTCATGIVNDFADYNAYPNDLEKWAPIGAVQVAALAPGASTSVSMPWSESGLAAGYWPLKCDLTTTGDPYDANNHVLTVEQAPVPSPSPSP